MARHIQNFFESLSSLTYNRLNKAIWSFAPFRLFFVYPEKFTLSRLTPPGRITNLCIKIVHLETLRNFAKIYKVFIVLEHIFSSSKSKISFLQAQISLGNSFYNRCCFLKEACRGGENYELNSSYKTWLRSYLFYKYIYIYCIYINSMRD